MNTATHRGGGPCGAIGCVVDGEFAPVAHCRCSMCREGHGAAFAPQLP